MMDQSSGDRVNFTHDFSEGVNWLSSTTFLTKRFFALIGAEGKKGEVGTTKIAIHQR